MATKLIDMDWKLQISLFDFVRLISFFHVTYYKWVPVYKSCWTVTDVYVILKQHTIFIKWYMIIFEHKLIDFMSTELQNDDNDASLPFRLIWCVFICVINESNPSCSMNPLRIKKMYDLSVRAQSQFAECFVIFCTENRIG